MKADPPSLRTVKGPINKAILISVGAVAVFFLISALLRPREPAYQGKPLSYWFERFNTTNRSQAAIALREMGPAAVPFLLKKAKSKDGDSLYDKIYRTIYIKAPMGWKRRMALPKPFDASGFDVGQLEPAAHAFNTPLHERVQQYGERKLERHQVAQSLQDL